MSWWIPPGAILRPQPVEVHEVDMRAGGEIQEFVAHSWYDYEGGKDQGLASLGGRDQVRLQGRGGPQPPTNS